MIALSSIVSVTRPPGLSPSCARIALGIVNCRFDEIVTIERLIVEDRCQCPERIPNEDGEGRRKGYSSGERNPLIVAGHQTGNHAHGKGCLGRMCATQRYSLLALCSSRPIGKSRHAARRAPFVTLMAA